jgi:hypothetical protein
MFYGVFAFSGLFRGYVAWILEDMGPDSTAFGGKIRGQWGR